MRQVLLDWISHLAANALGVGAAIVMFVALAGVLRRLGWRKPFELFSFIEWVMGLGRRRRPPQRAGSSMNVEFRDASGVVVNLGPLIRVTMRNHRGPAFELHRTVFINCDRRLIKVGAPVEVSVEDGLFREQLIVLFDHQNQLLFVQSAYSLEQLLDRINRACHGDAVA